MDNTKNHTPAPDETILLPAAQTEEEKIDVSKVSPDPEASSNDLIHTDLSDPEEESVQTEIIAEIIPASSKQSADPANPELKDHSAIADADEMSDPLQNITDTDASLAKDQMNGDNSQTVDVTEVVITEEPQSAALQSGKLESDSENSNAELADMKQAEEQILQTPSAQSAASQDASFTTEDTSDALKDASGPSKDPSDSSALSAPLAHTEYEEGSFIADEKAANARREEAERQALPKRPDLEMKARAESMKSDFAKNNPRFEQAKTASHSQLPPRPDQRKADSKSTSHIPPIPEDALSLEQQSFDQMKTDFSYGWKSLVHPGQAQKETRGLRIGILVLSAVLFIGLLLPFITVRADYYGMNNMMSRSFPLLGTWIGWLYLVMLIAMDMFTIMNKRSLALIFGVVPAILLGIAAIYNVVTGLIAIRQTGYYMFRILLGPGFYILLLAQIAVVGLVILCFIKDPERRQIQ